MHTVKSVSALHGCDAIGEKEISGKGGERGNEMSTEDPLKSFD